MNEPTMPVVFVSHGSPTLPFDEIPARTFLVGLGAKLPRPRAILCISAHWEAAVPSVTGASMPETIHDFAGFPRALYELKCDAPGSPKLADEVAGLLQTAGFKPNIDPRRGYDHGVWNPLMLIYPQSGIPVVQLSLIGGQSTEAHVALGRALAPLRDEGVLILASGGAVHNLRWLDWSNKGGVSDWAREFDRWVGARIEAGEIGELVDYRDDAPNAALAHPSEDHFLPLFVALGAAEAKTPKGRRLHDSFVFGSLSMAAYGWGM